MDTTESGKRLWKFNNSLLSDRELKKCIKQTMNKITNQYAILDNNSKNIMTSLHKDENHFIINIGDGSDMPTMRPKTGCLV